MSPSKKSKAKFIGLHLDEDLHEKVRLLAFQKKISNSRAYRELILKGLEV